MSTKLLDMITDLGELSVDDLLTLQEQIEQQLRTKSSQAKPDPMSIGQINLPGLHRPTSDEIEAHLPAVFTPEERVEAQKVEVGKLQQHINDLVQAKAVSQASILDTKVPPPSESTDQIELPGTYRRTPEEVEASIAAFHALFTSEQLEQARLVDLDTLSTGSKSASELLNEMREDRF